MVDDVNILCRIDWKCQTKFATSLAKSGLSCESLILNNNQCETLTCVTITVIERKSMSTFKSIFSLVACAIFLNFSLSACAQTTEEKPKPKLNTTVPWLQIKIWEFESLPVANPPRVITKTSFEGKTVYHISAACCDIPSQLFDESGTLVCYPSGGITGQGDGKCPAFLVNKSASSVVWQDTRAYVPNQRRVPNLP